MTTKVKFSNRPASVARPLYLASGTSAMLPVTSSEPAMITRTRPRANTEPAKNVGSVPQISRGIPAVVVIASSPANAM